MTWISEAYQNLLEGNYNTVISIYESEIEKDPENISNYLYLGLSYLLEKREQEVQTAWFLVFSQLQDKEIEIWTQELVNILEEEAKRQTDIKDYLRAWLIRCHLREILPEEINNLLHLVGLGISLNNFNFNCFYEWKLIELLNEKSAEEVHQRLLFEVLSDVLKYPCSEAIVLARSALKITNGSSELINKIIHIAQYMGYDQRFCLYSADLLQECLIYQPNNIVILKEICWQYQLSSHWDDSITNIKKLEKFCQDTPRKLYVKYLFLYVYLMSSDWKNIIKVLNEYKKVLIEMTEEKPVVMDKFVRECYLVTVQPILYIQDNISENRYLINQIAKLYQSHAQEDFCYPVYKNVTKLNSPKKLKIGYIGSTLRTHSVGILSRWLINYHDREKFAIGFYLVTQQEDEITQKWFREKADMCHNFSNRNIIEIITQIQKDEIDILVDLDSLTHNLTNTVIALKPAPIQVSWLGLDSCGLPAIDYFIADPYVLPDDAQNYYQEKIWRLPHTYLAVDGFEVGVPTLTREDLNIDNNAIIYFNMQGSLKRNPHTIHLQMKILKSVPNSYLLIKGTGDDKIVQQLFISIAEEEGVESDRIKFLPRTPTEEIHRANLPIADVVLDTYPYNGATTTLETLWQEVPLVTRVGEQFAARNSYGFMVNAGITEGIAWSDEEYVEWGVKLGTDEELRKQVSWKLKQAKKTSPLWKAKEFTQEMEKAYQKMWELYIQED